MSLSNYAVLLAMGVLLFICAHLSHGQIKRVEDGWIKRCFGAVSVMLFLLGMFYVCLVIGLYFGVLDINEFLKPIVFGGLLCYISFAVNDFVRAYLMFKKHKIFNFLIELFFGCWFTYCAIELIMKIFSPETINLNQLL